MRDKARIRRILQKLERYWLQQSHQDMRLGQILFSGRAKGDVDPFYVEDDVIEEFLDSTLEPLVDIDIDISDKDFLTLAKMAHERDITLNQLIVDILEVELEKFKGALDEPDEHCQQS